jgi:hypothetical protein
MCCMMLPRRGGALYLSTFVSKSQRKASERVRDHSTLDCENRFPVGMMGDAMGRLRQLVKFKERHQRQLTSGRREKLIAGLFVQHQIVSHA